MHHQISGLNSYPHEVAEMALAHSVADKVETASLTGGNRNTVACFYHRLHEIIAYETDQECHEVFDGEIEVDESYFGGKRKGKRGRGAAGKVQVFGLLKR